MEAKDTLNPRTVLCVRLARAQRTVATCLYDTGWDMTPGAANGRVLNELYGRVEEPFTMEIYSARGILHFTYVAGAKTIAIIRSAVLTYFPHFETEIISDYVGPGVAGKEIVAAEVHQQGNPVLPILYASEFGYTTSIRFLGTMFSIPFEDELLYQLTCYPARESVALHAEMRLNRGLEKLTRWIHPRRMFRPEAHSKIDQQVQEKCGSRLFWATMRISALCAVPAHSSSVERKIIRARLRSHVAAMARPVNAFNSLVGNSLQYQSRREGPPAATLAQNRKLQRPMLLSIRELSTLWTLPDLRNVPATPSVLSKTLPLPAPLPTESDSGGAITILGRGTYRDTERNFGIFRRDHRHHFFILGKAGNGKTPLLRRIAENEITNGNASIIVDSSGELVTDLIARTPMHRAKAVHVIDFQNRPRTRCWNFFSGDTPERRGSAGRRFVEALKRAGIISVSEQAEEMLHSAIAIVTTPGEASIQSLHAFLSNQQIRREVIAKHVTSRPLQKSGLLQWFEGEHRDTLDAVVRFIETLIAVDPVRETFCNDAPPLWSPQLLTSGEVVLLKISAPLLGKSIAAFLHAHLLEEVNFLIETQATKAAEQRRGLFLAIDGVAAAAQPRLVALLSEGRKLGISIALTAKQLAELTPPLVSAVQTNVGNVVTFGTTVGDAEIMAKGLNDQISSEDIANLATGHFYGTLVVDGQPGGVFSARLLSGEPMLRGTAANVSSHSTKREAAKRTMLQATPVLSNGPSQLGAPHSEMSNAA